MSDIQACSPTESASDTQLVVFSLADEQYALPISVVKEVLNYTRPRPVASRDPWMTGVINLRGKITPVCDLAARLGLSSDVPYEGRKIVVLESSDASSGLIVDDICQVTTVNVSQLEHEPTADAGLVNAIAKLDESLVVLLNPASFIPAD